MRRQRLNLFERMLITRSDDGYFGLRRSLALVFDKAALSWFDRIKSYRRDSA